MPTRQYKEGAVREVKSAGRAVELLEYLAERQANPPRLQEIATALRAPRSSVYALLRTLASLGWVSTDGGDGYRLGIRALTTGTSYIDADPHVRVVRPILADLAAALGETFHMGRIDGHAVVYLATQQSRKDARTYSRVGRRMPATATGLGKAVLARRPDIVPTTFQTLTPNSISSATALKKAMSATRARGYALDDEENTLGLRCIAFALPYTDPVTDAISCSVPVTRWSDGHSEEIVAGMREAVVRAVESAPLAT